MRWELSIRPAWVGWPLGRAIVAQMIDERRARRLRGVELARLGAVPVGPAHAVRGLGTGRHPTSSVLESGLTATRPSRSAPTSAAGTWVAVVDGVGHGDRYRFRLDDGEPARRPGVGLAARRRARPVGRRRRRPLRRGPTTAGAASSSADTVLYELHVGHVHAGGHASTPPSAQLDRLVRLGVTTVELMPVNAFPGRRNWGYDGVFPSAVQESLRRSGRARPLRRRRPRPRARPSCSTSSTTTSARRARCTRSTVRTSSTRTTRRGATASTWPRPAATCPADVRRERHPVDHRLPRRRAAPRRHRHDLRPDGRAVPRAAVDAVHPPARRPGARSSRSSRAAANNPDHVPPRSPGAASAPTRRGTTTCTTRCGWRSPATRGGTTSTTRARPTSPTRSTNRWVFTGRYSTVPRPPPRPAGRRRRARPLRRVQRQPRPRRQHPRRRPPAVRPPAAAGRGGDDRARSGFTPMLFMGEEYAETRPFPYFVDHSDPTLLRGRSRGPAAASSRKAEWTEAVADPADPATFEAAVLDPSVAERPPHAPVLAAYTELLALRRSQRRGPRSGRRSARAPNGSRRDRRAPARRTAGRSSCSTSATSRPRSAVDADAGGRVRHRRRALGRRRLPAVVDGTTLHARRPDRGAAPQSLTRCQHDGRETSRARRSSVEASPPASVVVEQHVAPTAVGQGRAWRRSGCAPGTPDDGHAPAARPQGRGGRRRSRDRHGRPRWPAAGSRRRDRTTSWRRRRRASSRCRTTARAASAVRLGPASAPSRSTATADEQRRARPGRGAAGCPGRRGGTGTPRCPGTRRERRARSTGRPAWPARWPDHAGRSRPPARPAAATPAASWARAASRAS